MSIDLSRRLGLPVVLACAALAGCVQVPKPLYGWGSYQGQVYAYLKGQGDGPQAQISVLEADLQRFRSAGLSAPPGYHAHLGLLYAAAGKDDAAAEQLLTEKTLFPESATYIDFLLANKTGKAGNNK
ncbi:MAG: DUF4810 domain-containing protein [Leptothrix sp. (in: b-proteobacteria)]